MTESNQNKLVSFDGSKAAINAALGSPEPKPGELEAMRDGMGSLVDLLTYCRAHGSEGEADFVRLWLLPRLRKLGVEPELDGFGNIWVYKAQPGARSHDFLWSCHVDTVHAQGKKRQGVVWDADGRTLKLAKRKAGHCLGADDGAGVWLMLQMLEAGVPGGYVFHRGEECGRLGSTYVHDSEPERLGGWEACIAFDRRDYRDIITHQMGQRCASDSFASTFSFALNQTGQGLKYVGDDTGSYTDSYTYADTISECCNVSVGYDSEHGPRETLDALHLWRLRNAVVSADFSGVICERDPSTFDEWDYYGGYGGGWGRVGGGSRTGAAAWGNEREPDSESETLLELVRRFPAATVELLGVYGLRSDDLLDHLSPSELTSALGMLGDDNEDLAWSNGAM